MGAAASHSSRADVSERSRTEQMSPELARPGKLRRPTNEAQKLALALTVSQGVIGGVSSGHIVLRKAWPARAGDLSCHICLFVILQCASDTSTKLAQQLARQYTKVSSGARVLLFVQEERSFR